MLQEAVNQANNGKNVLVVANDEGHRRLLRTQCALMCGSDVKMSDALTTTKGGVITFVIPETTEIDWQRMTPRSALQSCVTLVDHYAIETRFSAVFDMWERFNLNTEETDNERALSWDSINR